MNAKLAAILLILVLMIVPALSFSRVNSLTGGLGVSLDLDDRSYDNDGREGVDSRDDDYRRFVLTPMLHFQSRSEKDSFELRTAPSIKYDLIDSGTDWDNNLYIAADRFMTKSWQLNASNHLIRSDYYREGSDSFSEPQDQVAENGSSPSETTEEVASAADPQLSTNPGRRRYWRNTFNIFSNHYYREDSLFRGGFSYIILSNDDTGVGGYDDYDRYEVSLLNRHRFSPAWQSILDLRFVRGNYDPADQEVANAVVDALAPAADITLTDDQLSNDIKEYHLLLTAQNDSIVHNPLFLTYNYIGSKYDEILRNDSDIHQMRFTWQRVYSPHVYTKLGIGPSYEKTEGTDANWGGNGIAELNYQIERGSFRFLLDKRYDVNNFNGTNERGLVDIWDSRFSFSYRLLSDLSLTGLLSYVYEDREDPVVALGRIVSSDDPQGVLGNEDITQLEEYHKDRYIAGVGLRYSFLQFYSANIDYTYTNQDSERIGDTYDDHRLLLTLSWQKELFHW